MQTVTYMTCPFHTIYLNQQNTEFNDNDKSPKAGHSYNLRRQIIKMEKHALVDFNAYNDIETVGVH